MYDLISYCYANVLQKIPTVCKKDAHPPICNELRQKCQKLWQKAKKVVPPADHEEFKSAAMIEINDGHEKFMCYSDDIWRAKGWCYVDWSSASVEHEWGVCSSSCKFIDKPKEEVTVELLFNELKLLSVFN